MPSGAFIVFFSLWAIALGLPARLAAQEGLPEISLQELGYRLKHWTVDDGLPSGFAFSVVQTPDGYIWASTLTGVARCDGRRFTGFHNPEEDPPYFHRPFLQVDDEGRLWSLSRQGGMVVLFENGSPRLLGPEDGLPSGYLIPVNGSGSRMPYLQKFTNENKPQPLILRTDGTTFASPSSLDLPILNDLIEDRFDGAMIGRTGERRLIEIQADKFEILDLPIPQDQAQPEVVSFFEDRTGHPAALTTLGVFIRKEGTWILERPLSLPSGLPGVMTAGFDWHGYLWLISHNEIKVVDKEGTIRVVKPRPFENLMNHFFVDREGSIWIPTKQGLYQLVQTEFTSWQVDSEGKSNTTFKASEDGKGRIWVSGELNTFFLEPNRATFQPVPGPALPSISVNGIPSGGAYVKRMGSILHFATPDQVRDLPPTKGSLTFTTRDGTYWSGDEKGLVRRTNPDTDGESIPFIPESGNGVMTEDSLGQRFLTVRGLGVIQLDGVSQPRLITPAPNSPIAKRPNSVMADPDDNIWFISRGPNGLGYWNPREDNWHFATWTDLETPFPIPINLSLNADHEGGFWVVSTSGVLQCDRKELMNAMTTGQSVPWRSLQKSDGLPTIAASFHNQGSFLDSRGRIWIPTDAGITMTDPARWKKVREKLPPPPVLVTGVSIDNEEVSLSPEKDLTVEPGGHLLEMNFKALHFGTPDRVSYRYRLLGFEDEWATTGTSTQVRYQKLPPGTYQFEVTADNGFGNWSEDGATLSIIVQPQWWERTSVRILTAVALLVAGFLLYQRRVRRLDRARNRQEELSRKLIATQEFERQRLSRELHDGLGQNLLVIKNGLALEAERNKESTLAKEAFHRYANAAGDCLSEVRQMSQDLRPHQIDRLGLTVALESVADRLAASSHVSIKHEVDELDGRFAPDDEIHLLRIVQESLGNAIRHSDASEVKLRVQNQSDSVHLTVSDDGKGFHVEETRARPRSEGGLGLISIEERARMLGGTCRFTSSPGEGTTVDIHLPILTKQP